MSEKEHDEEIKWAKVVVRIPAKDNEILNSLLGWGHKTKLFTLIAEDLISELKKDPQKIVAQIYAGHLKLSDFVQKNDRISALKELEENTNGES